MSEPTFSGQATSTDRSPPGGDVETAPLNTSTPEAESTFSGRGTVGFEGMAPSTASDFNAAAADLQGPVIEIVDLSLRYEVLNRLGAGGMGEVFRAHDRKLNRPVAIKRLKAELARDARQLQRFVDEARTVAALSHAHILHVYDFGRDTQGPFLILEFLDGESLAERIKRGPLELHDCLRLFIPICEAVSFAHAHGVIHRDIKPGNILISASGVPKLGDFGIARQTVVEGHTVAGAVLGTLDYMSPEQMNDSTQVDGRSDLWSLASTIYEVLTCRSPRFWEPDSLPLEIREAVVRARRHSPGDRQSSVAEFTSQLRALISGDRVTTTFQALREGECPKCHTLNRTDRKFCKVQGCGTPLYEACPACHTSAPAWEPVCGECGIDIPAAWTEKEREIETSSQQIRALTSEYRFAEAETLLAKFDALPKPRYQKWHGWAQEYAVEFHSAKRQQEILRDQLFESAMIAFNVSDYDEALSLLRQIPLGMHTDAIRNLEQSAQTRLTELQSLLDDVRRLVETKQHDGLRAKVDRILALSPGDQRIAKLNQQLLEREEQQRKEQEAAKSKSLPKNPNRSRPPLKVSSKTAEIIAAARAQGAFQPRSVSSSNQRTPQQRGSRSTAEIIATARAEGAFKSTPTRSDLSMANESPGFANKARDASFGSTAGTSKSPTRKLSTAEILAMARAERGLNPSGQSKNDRHSNKPNTWIVPSKDGLTIAIAMEKAMPGDTILVLRGTHPGSIDLKPGVSLTGEDRDRCIIECDVSNLHALRIQNATSGSVSNLTFIPNDRAPERTDFSANLQMVHGIVIHDSRILIKNCVLRDFPGCGIDVAGRRSSPTLTSNICDRNWRHGIRFGAAAIGIAEQNECSKNGDSGIFVTGTGTAPTLKNNTCDGNKRHGITFEAEAGGIAELNVCRKNLAAGIHVNGAKTTPTLSSNVCEQNPEPQILYTGKAKKGWSWWS